MEKLVNLYPELLMGSLYGKDIPTVYRDLPFNNYLLMVQVLIISI
jgi:hypothetical protein